jgi:hypothetical protein
MQAATATMCPELMTMAPTASAEAKTSRFDRRRIAKIAFMFVGVAATAFILGQYESLLVYGLPAPFMRRVPVNVPA